MATPRLTLDEFCAAARKVIDDLPAEFRARLENVVVDVEPRASRRLLRELGMDPDEDELLGLFEGTSILDQDYETPTPNRIRLFQNAIEEACRSKAEVVYEIRRTILHELAHHFGYDEDDLDEFESQPRPFDDDE